MSMDAIQCSKAMQLNHINSGEATPGSSQKRHKIHSKTPATGYLSVKLYTVALRLHRNKTTAAAAAEIYKNVQKGC